MSKNCLRETDIEVQVGLQEVGPGIRRIPRFQTPNSQGGQDLTPPLHPFSPSQFCTIKCCRMPSALFSQGVIKILSQVQYQKTCAAGTSSAANPLDLLSSQSKSLVPCRCRCKFWGQRAVRIQSYGKACSYFLFSMHCTNRTSPP